MRLDPARKPFFGQLIQALWSRQDDETIVPLLLAAIHVRDAAPNLGRFDLLTLDTLLANATGTLVPTLTLEAADILASPFVRRSRTLEGVDGPEASIRRVDEVIANARRAAAASEDGSAESALRAMVSELAERHPRLGLSFGYVGNCDLHGGRWDDRSWKVFTKLATRSFANACDVGFGSHGTPELGRLMIVAERDLASWCAEQERRLDAGEIHVVRNRLAA